MKSPAYPKASLFFESVCLFNFHCLTNFRPVIKYASRLSVFKQNKREKNEYRVLHDNTLNRYTAVAT